MCLLLWCCLTHTWAGPERSNFGTDLYMVEGLAHLLGGRHHLRLVDGAGGVAALLEECGSSVAAVVLTHVCYRTGRMLDMAGLTRLAHQQCAAALMPTPLWLGRRSDSHSCD